LSDPAHDDERQHDDLRKRDECALHRRPHAHRSQRRDRAGVAEYAKHEQHVAGMDRRLAHDHRFRPIVVARVRQQQPSTDRGQQRSQRHSDEDGREQQNPGQISRIDSGRTRD